MDGIADRATVAYSDAGTPLDVSDDLLYLADPAQNVVLRYSLGPSSAVLTARWDGFDGPIRLATGRWNDMSNRLLCVADAPAKGVRVFQDDDRMLVPLGEHRADHRPYDSAMTTDHFGQVYLVDEVGAGVEEYTPSSNSQMLRAATGRSRPDCTRCRLTGDRRRPACAFAGFVQVRSPG